MSIRTKTLTIVAATFFTLVAFLMILARHTVMGGFIKLEEDEIRLGISRGVNAIASIVSGLDASSADWAAWDESYTYIRGRNRDFIARNLMDATFNNLNINFMLYLDESQNMVFAKFFDLQKREETLPPPGFPEKLSSMHNVLRHTRTDSYRKGLLMTSRGPVCLASRPILRSDSSGPIGGTLIIGRYLGEPEIKRLSQITQLSLAILSVKDERIPPEVREALTSSDRETPVLVKPEGGETISGYSVLKDIQGEPALLLKIQTPRRIFVQGRGTLLFYVLSLAFIGLVFILLIMLFLERGLLAPLTRLSSDVREIAKRGDPSRTLPVSRNDELGTLANEINRLLAQLKGKTVALEEANDKLRQDILMRQRAEQALQRSEERYRNLVEESFDGIFIQKGSRIIFANRRLHEMLGYEQGELEGMEHWLVYHPEYQRITRERALARIKGEDVTGRYEVRLQRRDGSSFYGEINAKAVTVEGEQGIQVWIRDLTEQKAAERDRKQFEAQIQRGQKMEAIGALAGGVAHDLNNVLSGLVSYPELLLMDLPDHSPLRKPILTIQKSGEKAAAIVQDLLTLARRGVSVMEVVNLNDLVSEYLRSPEYERLISFHPDVQVEVNLEADLLNIDGSPVHLSKTVMNLVSNATEAMPRGGKVSISTENRYVDRPVRGYDQVKEGDYAVLTVRDTGVGIPEKDMDRIFEPFYTKKAMGRSGTGLGLAVVWGTVKDHRGYVDVHSAKGQETVFRLYFPVTHRAIERLDSRVSLQDLRGGGESVLVVDDVEEQREIAASILAQLGYSVALASSGEEAVEHMKTHSADILILDMIMDPGMDGLDTYRGILQLHPKQKAIIVSGFSETERVKEAQRLGAGAYVKKPFRLETIGKAVKRELERRWP
ncbi:MAG: PAS domain S-box protein [Deltaproteobacteria bacterium]|nr:PAS domain S-box protein [Deltaproteobacteria bacterium]